MFILNEQIQAWRETLLQREAFQPDDVDELESHIRDEVAGLTAKGLPEEEAFSVALKRLGHTDLLGGEFHKVNAALIWGKRLQWTLSLLACVLIAMPMYELLQANENTDFDAWDVRSNFYLATAFCLMIAAAVLLGLRQYKSQPDVILRASRLSDEHLSGAPSWDELQKKGGTRRLFAWLMDCVSMIAGVFFFALVACMICNTRPILAAVCLTLAVLFPSLAKRSHRTREVLFGVPSRDKSRR